VFSPIEGQEDEEGASLDVRGIGAHFCCGFFTILDKVLTVGESAGGTEQAAWLHSHPEDLLEGAGGGGAVAVREIARQRTSPRHSGGETSTARSVA
jgi:hypothetical protein